MILDLDQKYKGTYGLC